MTRTRIGTVGLALVVLGTGLSIGAAPHPREQAVVLATTIVGADLGAVSVAVLALTIVGADFSRPAAAQDPPPAARAAAPVDLTGYWASIVSEDWRWRMMTPPKGSLKVMTTNVRAGYVRKNGVPYSEQASIAEYFDRLTYPNGDVVLIVRTVVDDPRYLQAPFITSTNFKLERDGSKWKPTPCRIDPPAVDAVRQP